MVNNKEDGFEDEDEIDGQISVTQRSQNNLGQLSLESKISRIGQNLKAIQENLHSVVNSIQTMESTK